MFTETNIQQQTPADGKLDRNSIKLHRKYTKKKCVKKLGRICTILFQIISLKTYLPHLLYSNIKVLCARKPGWIKNLYGFEICEQIKSEGTLEISKIFH